MDSLRCSCCGSRHGDRLYAGERFQAPWAQLAADAARLEAAPGGVGEYHLGDVDPDVAGVDARGHAPRAFLVAAHYGRCQPVRRVVGELDGFSLALELRRAQDRAEDFLAPQRM